MMTEHLHHSNIVLDEDEEDSPSNVSVEMERNNDHMALAYEKLKPKGRSWPSYSNRLLTDVTDRLKKNTDDIIKTHSEKYNKQKKKKHISNLTHCEYNGLKWCKQMIKSKSIYITKADKGWTILILNTYVVNDIMIQNLEDSDSFRQLDNDPRPMIKEQKEKLIKKWEE